MRLKKQEEVSILDGLWDLALGVLNGLGTLEARALKSFAKYKRASQGWLVRVVALGLSVFMCLAFLVLGLFFVAIDYGGVPRGIVFICGGLLGLLVLRLMVPPTK